MTLTENDLLLARHFNPSATPDMSLVLLSQALAAGLVERDQTGQLRLTEAGEDAIREIGINPNALLTPLC